MTEDTTGVQQAAGTQSIPSATGNAGGANETGSAPRVSEGVLTVFRIFICFALLIPIIQLYFTIPAAISMWVADQYVPFINMVYFILVIIGGVWLLQYTFRFSEEERTRLKK